MEFWGKPPPFDQAFQRVEVKAGEPLSVCPDDGQLIHISQVALGEVKNMKAANYIPIRLKVNGKKFVIGTLSAEREPQITFDLVLEKEFELSHNWKDGSIYFCGYTADEQDDGLVAHDFSDEDDDEDEEEENTLENGKSVPDVQVAKPKSKSKAVPAKPESSAKPKVLVEPKKESYGSDESDDIDDESDDDFEDDDDMSEDEDEETPKKVEQSKKRPSDSAIKTPASTKKAKIGTPQKTDGKKGSAHTATPHPSKKSEKKTSETPKSSGSASCKTCSKTFNSKMALESHSKAKHGGK